MVQREGPLRDSSSECRTFYFNTCGRCFTFPLNLITDTLFSLFIYFSYTLSIQEMISQRERTQTGTGRFIALAVGHLISAQKVMKSLK